MVSIMEPECVTAVCCLGFPLISLEGYRGQNIDPLLDVKCPVFIAVGSQAANTDIDELEDMRDQFKCKSKLLVVDGADSLLRVPTDIQLKNKESYLKTCILQNTYKSAFWTVYRKMASLEMTKKENSIND